MDFPKKSGKQGHARSDSGRYHFYDKNSTVIIRATIETNECQRRDLVTDNRLPEDKLLVLKTSSKPMLVVFSQLDLFISGTSFGSAKVMSAH